MSPQILILLRSPTLYRSQWHKFVADQNFLPTKHTTGNCTGCTLLSWQRSAQTPKQKKTKTQSTNTGKTVKRLLNENASQLLTWKWWLKKDKGFKNWKVFQIRSFVWPSKHWLKLCFLRIEVPTSQLQLLFWKYLRCSISNRFQPRHSQETISIIGQILCQTYWLWGPSFWIACSKSKLPEFPGKLPTAMSQYVAETKMIWPSLDFCLVATNSLCKEFTQDRSCCIYFENMSKPLVWCANERISKWWLSLRHVTPNHSISMSSYVTTFPVWAVNSRMITNLWYPNSGTSDGNGLGFYHTATPLIVSHWSLTEAADWTRKWQVNHPMITQLFLRVGPKDPTHCNAAGPQESWSPCWQTREPKDWFKSKDLPLRRQQHSLPSFHKLSPSCEGLHSTCKSKFENLHELVCEVSIRNTYPSCPVFWVFRAQFSIVSHIPFSRFSHLLANGLKACSPLGPRLQCLTALIVDLTWIVGCQATGVSGGFKHHRSIWIINYLLQILTKENEFK